MMRKNLLNWEETLFRDPDVFELNYIPDQFSYRDTQTEMLSFAIRPGLRGGKILDTVCRGPPSTGKTTSIKMIFEEIGETTKTIVPVYVNCHIDNTEFAIFSRIYTSLTKNSAPSSGTSIKQLVDAIGLFVQSSRIIPLVCLDDANYLIYDDQFNNIIYPLSRMHETHPGTNFGIIVIISDTSIDLQQVMDVRVQSTFRPEVIQYPPYSAKEMAGILDLRVKAGLYPNVFSPELLDSVVENCMIYGDVRLGLNLIKRSVLNAEKEARTAVTEADLEKAISSLRDSHLSDLIHFLSNDEKLVLKHIATLFTEESSPTSKEIGESLPPDGPKLTRLSEILKHLDMLHLIELEYATSGRGRRRYVHLHVDKRIVLSILEKELDTTNQ